MPREYKFNERGLPTLAEKWTGEIPPLKDFPETTTGRRARGQLENMLDHVCKKWLLKGAELGYPDKCTAEWLVTAVSELDGKPTSSGAIGRVFKRWKDLGYAMIEDRPLRFVGLTADGMKAGLEELERRSKRKRKGTSHFDWDAAAQKKGSK